MASMARYLGRMAIGQVIPLDWATRRIISMLSRTTGTYRRTDMLRDIREARDINQFGASVRDLAVNIRPPQDIMVETELTRRRKYRVFGRVKEIDIDTGRVQYSVKSFYTDSLRTKEQWVDEFQQQKQQPDSAPQF